MEIKCPECEEYIPEPDDCYTEDELYEVECSNCNMYFGVTPYYIKGYREHKLPCANGEPHYYQRTHTYPIEFTKMRCTYCEAERDPTEDEWEIINKES